MRQVYLAWIAYNNDPFKWAYEKHKWHDPEERYVLDRETGNPIEGPNLSFITKSEFADSIDEVHLIMGTKDHSKTVYKELVKELYSSAYSNSNPIEQHSYCGEDIQNHEEMFFEMRNIIRKEILESLQERSEILININPGPPAAQFVWLTLGLADRPFWKEHRPRLFQGIPPHARSDLDDPKQIAREIDFRLPTLYNLVSDSFEEGEEQEPKGSAGNIAEDVHSESNAMEECLDLLGRYAPTNYPIMLLGETGAGKTTLAERFHRFNPNRCDQEFVSLPCGEHDENGLKTELFGCTKESYTDVGEHIGAIERANGGTLFLDEIHDMSRKMQRMLIHVLQDKTYFKHGGVKRLNSDFRLICGSNWTLPELRTKLDADFIYRILKVRIVVPPLRKRRDAMQEYWNKILEKDIDRNIPGEIIVEYEDGAKEALMSWLMSAELRGNFRSLEQLAANIVPVALEEGDGICVITKRCVHRAIGEVEEFERVISTPIDRVSAEH